MSRAKKHYDHEDNEELRHHEQIQANKESNLETIKYYTDRGKPVPPYMKKGMVKNTEFSKKYIDDRSDY
jgi:hypothetical protein